MNEKVLTMSMRIPYETDLTDAEWAEIAPLCCLPLANRAPNDAWTRARWSMPCAIGNAPAASGATCRTTSPSGTRCGSTSTSGPGTV